MSEEPKEQQLGEWRTNPFLDPQVRNKILQLENDHKMEVIQNTETRKAMKWIQETYPEIIEQYQAMRDIERAEYEAKHKFFGEIK
jgi:hypothetical protein